MKRQVIQLILLQNKGNIILGEPSLSCASKPTLDYLCNMFKKWNWDAIGIGQRIQCHGG